MSTLSRPATTRGPLLAVAAGTFLVLVTYVTPMATLPPTAADLGVGASARAWILSSMSVGLAGALLAAGVLGDARGRRRVYLGGLWVLVLGAALAGAAWDPWVLVVARLAQGVGGAAMLACGLALLAGAYPIGPARIRATSVWGAAVGGGVAGGSVLAVVLDVGTSWRENYLATAVLGAVLVLPSMRTLVESRAALPRRVDVPGLVLLGAGMVASVAALTQARSGWGWGVTGLFAVAVLSFAVFARAEARSQSPLVDPTLLRSPRLLSAVLGAFTLGWTMIALASFLPTVAQVGFGDSLRLASLPPLAWAVASTATAVALPRLAIDLQGPRAVGVLLLLTAAGMGLAVLADSTLELILPMALAGATTGLLNAVLGRESVASVPLDAAAMASGATNTARYLGAACGITLFAMIATHAGEDIVAGWRFAVVLAAALCAVGAVGIAALGHRGRAS